MAYETQWTDPYDGFEYTTDTVVVEADHQREKLAICGLDPDVFGNAVDAENDRHPFSPIRPVRAACPGTA